MGLLDSMFGIEDIPEAKLADQLIRRYALFAAEKDVADRGLNAVLGGNKADELEKKLDIELKRRALGMEPEDMEEQSLLGKFAPYAATAGIAKGLSSPLLSKGLSSIFGGKAGALSPLLKEATDVGSGASVISKLLRRRA